MTMDRNRALSLLKLTEANASRPERVEARLALLRDSLAGSDPAKLAEVEAAADLLLFPEGRPTRIGRLWSWFHALGPVTRILLLLLVAAAGARWVLPWLHPDAALERVPPLLRELATSSARGELAAVESMAGRVLTLAERSTEALREAPGDRGERLRARWMVDSDGLLAALLERSFEEGRRRRAEETRRVLALYRRAHDLRRRLEADPGRPAG